MRYTRWPTALLGLCLCAAGGRAQPLVYPNPYGHGYAPGGGFGLTYTRARPGKRLSITLSTLAPGPLSGDPLYGPLYAPPVGRVTIIYYTPPPLVVLPTSRLLLEGLPLDLLPRGRLEPRERSRPPEPEDEEPAPRPPPPPRPRVPPPPPKEPPKPPPEKEPPPPPDEERGEKKPRELPRPPAPEDDPRDEHERLVRLGRAAFARGEYGRAVLRFRQANRVQPKEPPAYFLLGQALFALGKYHEAVDAIRAGLALRPDWPRVAFRPLQLYGENVAEYPEHLRTLEGVLGKHPNDPVLLFLYAYQLWFDGRKDESAPLFRRALRGAADPEAVRRFLRALPPAPVM
jgi:hypothetical protein